MTQLIGIGGTLRQNSRTRAALQTALAIAQEQGAQTQLLDLRELDLPMYHPEYELNDYPRRHWQSIETLLEACRRADGVLWSSATYHGTITGVFKNALDFLELLADDAIPYLRGRAVGLIIVADPITFPAMSAAAQELQAWLAPTYVTLSRQDFSPNFTLNDGKGRRRLARLVGELMAFAETRRGAMIRGEP